MNLLSEAQRIVAQISALNEESATISKTLLRRAYELVNTKGKEQEILDTLGSKAATALQIYAIRYAAEAQIAGLSGQNLELPPPNFEVFVPNPDGTVNFIAPEEIPLDNEQEEDIIGE